MVVRLQILNQWAENPFNKKTLIGGFKHLTSIANFFFFFQQKVLIFYTACSLVFFVKDIECRSYDVTL